MKFLKNLTLVAVMVSFGVLSSCKKEKDTPAPAPATKTTLLTAKSWKITAITVSPAFPVIGSDVYAILEPCDKDDLVKFSAASATAMSGTAMTDVKTKCEASDMNESGTWSFNSAQTQITTDIITGDTIVATVLELMATTMKASYVEDGYTYTVTWAAQ